MEVAISLGECLLITKNRRKKRALLELKGIRNKFTLIFIPPGNSRYVFFLFRFLLFIYVSLKKFNCLTVVFFCLVFYLTAFKSLVELQWCAHIALARLWDTVGDHIKVVVFLQKDYVGFIRLRIEVLALLNYLAWVHKRLGLLTDLNLCGHFISLRGNTMSNRWV